MREEHSLNIVFQKRFCFAEYFKEEAGGMGTCSGGNVNEEVRAIPRFLPNLL